MESVAKGPIKFVKGIPAKLNKKVAREICEYILNIPSTCGRGVGEGEKDTRSSFPESSLEHALLHKEGGCTDVHFQMQKIKIPARWERISFSSTTRGLNPLLGKRNEIILEGAHSAPRFEYILPKIRKITGKRIGVFAMARNHDPKTFQIILSEFEDIIWTTVPGIREFWEPEELCKSMGRGRVEKNPIKAFQKAQDLPPRRTGGGTTIVTGSFYLCGTIRDLFYAPEKILEQRTEFPI